MREPARRLAAAMAVVNQRAGLVEIGRVAGVDVPIEPFEELLGTGFVHWEPAEPGTPVAFVHPLYRQAIYQDLPPRTRAATCTAPPSVSLDRRRHWRIASPRLTVPTMRWLRSSSVRPASTRERRSATSAARSLLWASSLSSDPRRAEERLLAAAQAYVDSGQTLRATARYAPASRPVGRLRNATSCSG